jgi:hypothetical protein
VIAVETGLIIGKTRSNATFLNATKTTFARRRTIARTARGRLNASVVSTAGPEPKLRPGQICCKSKILLHRHPPQAPSNRSGLTLDFPIT